MKLITTTLLTILLTLTSSFTTSNSEQYSITSKQEVFRNYFIYHGIADIITDDMTFFTKKYAISFQNNGCNILNKNATEIHNAHIADILSHNLGNTDWIDELPIKILGVN